MAPRADFVYEEWQDATFNYINAVPQFVNFNSGNWQAMEEAVRDYAEKTSAILQVSIKSRNDSILEVPNKFEFATFLTQSNKLKYLIGFFQFSS